MKQEVSKKQKLMKKSKMTNKSKALMISAITATAVASLVGVQNAEASNYMWSKYNVNGNEEELWTGTTIGNGSYFDFTELAAIYEKQGYSNVFGRSFNIGFETDEFGMYTGRSIYAHTLYGTKYTKGILVGTIQAGLNAYENNARNSDGYWYERGQIVNEAPSTPTLSIPNEAFEHGDKRFISFGATDPDGDILTYTLRASYDEGKTWSEIYKGTSKVFEYTVPSDKTNVQFRVLASDGQYSVSSAISAKKDIREVQYYWSKYNAVNPLTWSDTVQSNASAYVEWHGGISYNSEWEEMGLPSFPNGTSYKQLSYSPDKGFYNSNGQDPVEVEVGSWGELSYALIPYNTSYRKGYFYITIHANGSKSAYYYYKHQVSNPTVFVRGSLISNSLQGGYNAYQAGIRNADSYWYERGQRVLSEDTTPPIIELTEQSEYAPTSTVGVKVYDLSAIKSVKYAKGEQTTGYFASNGTAVTGEKFVATENGNYTVYAEDAKGNKIVQVINVTKVNNAPTLPTLTVPEVPFEHGDKQFIQFGSTDADGQAITYTLEALYDGSNTPVQLYQGTDRTFGYTVPKDKTQVQFRVKATDGIETTQYTTSEPKNISEVQYYWNKFQFINHPTQKWVNRHEQYPMYSLTDEQWQAKIKAIQDNPKYRLNYAHFAVDPVGYNLDYDELVTDTNQVKTFINTLQAGYNAYPDQKLHTDGYWYERGQRVAAEDKTPPIIELTEQSDYGATSTVTVRTHDISNVELVKWDKGNRSPLHFFSNGGNIIATGQSTSSSFTVSENGTYTVYAIDDKGNRTVKTIDVTKVNSPPVVNSIEAIDKFNVVDDTTDYSIRGVVSDLDGQSQSVKVTYNGKTVQATVSGNGFEAILKGSEYEKGYHQSNISVVSNDGFVDSDSKTLEHIVIKVDNAADYTRDLNAHSEEPDNYSATQHEAFYNAYESILSYEAQRSADALQNANGKIATLKASTVSESVTLTNWQNRLDLVTATVATEVAEKSLSRDDFEKAKELVVALTPSNSKDQLVERINELQRYHDAYEAITALEDNKESVSWDKINDAQEKVNVVENAENQKELQDRLTQVIKDYMSDLTTITPDDLDKFGVTDVVAENSDLYDEYKDAFKPLGENTNAQDLVDFVNALKVALSDVTPSAVNTMNSKVPDYAKEALSPVVTTMDKLLDKRQTFVIEDTKDQALSNSIQGVNYEITKTYMNTINTAMKEVIEYNDTHDANEKSEAHTATEVLWQGQLRTDMQSYLDNGIPEIIVLADVYEYINDGKLNVIASIQDSNDTTHEVKVSFNGETKTVTSTDGKINVSFDLEDGVYEDHVTIVAKDKLTEKTHTIMNKPVVVVSDVEMYKRFAQALEADKGQSFDAFDKTTHNALKTLFDKTLAIKINVSSEREIREVENSATKLGGKNGQLETLVKSLVQTNRLVWLINNYKIATDDDFAWAGVEGVTLENIDGLKSIIDDYVASFNDEEVKTPTVEDYQNWLSLSAILEDAKKAIEIAEGQHTKEELEDAISNAETILEKVPSWLSAKAELQTRLEAVIAYFNVIESVITSETTYIQADKDTAQTLVDGLVDGTPKNNLQIRLDAVQVVIDAIGAVETVETTLEETDQVIAQSLVDKIEPSNAKKAELQARLDAIVKVKEAIAAVEHVESTKIQQDLDIAKELVDALPSSPIKEELLERLQAVQDVIDNKSKEDQAKDAVSNAENSLLQEDKDKAQEKVDALDEGKLKEDLQDRLDDLQQYVDAYSVAEKAVEMAEKSKANPDVDSAQALVNELPNSKAKDSLNERLVLVTKYILAEKAVSKAEVNVLQKHKDDAQVLVNELEESPDKQALQDRLNALQILIDNKVKDLLDKLINDPSSVTSQELADYTGETVYEEIMDEYIDKIIEESDNLSKEKVIQIVKLLNALELSKRSMGIVDIKKYETEFDKAKSMMSVSKYPTPIFLLAIEKYITDDSIINDLIEIVAAETGKTIEEVQAEMDALKSFGQVKLGSYTIQYVDTDGNLIHEDSYTDVPFGKTELTLALDGYKIIVDENSVREFEMNAKNNGQVFKFTVEPIQEVTTGSYTVQYVDSETNEIVHEELFEDIEFGDVLVKGSLKDYEIILEDGSTTDSNEKEIVLSKDNNNETVVFLVKKFNFFESLEPDESEDINEGETSQETEIDNPTEIEQDEQEGNVDLPTEEQDVEQENNVEAQTMSKSATSRTFRVASLDDTYLSFSPNVEVKQQEEGHTSYLTKALYALEGVKTVKTLGSSVSEEYVAHVENYIVTNVYDGEYKEYLLKELGDSINDDIGNPNLTPVHPTPPTPPVIPPVKPPVEEVVPPVVTPPTEETPPPTVTNPPVGEITPPTVTPPQIEDDKGDTGKDNSVELTESDKGYTWTIENPKGKEYVVEANGVKITIPLDEFADAKAIEVGWTLVSKNHYKLVLKVDGKEITKLKKVIKVEKEHGFAYLLRGNTGEYAAMPYTYKNKTFQFETKNLKTPFYFKTVKRSFDDIKGIYSQDAIEELASRNIVQGTTSTTYSPYRNITRSQFSVMIVRALALETTGDTKFNDINGHWAQKEIQALNEIGVVNGVTETSFNPNGELTRQQAALMLYRLLKVYGVDMAYTEPNFDDADKLSGDVREAVGALQDLGIFEGSNGKFNPNDKLTRMQMAKVLQRTLALTGNF